MRSLSPTYNLTEDQADALIETSSLSIPWEKENASLTDTLDRMEDIIHRCRGQVKLLAKALKGDTIEQSAYNAWHFVKRFIKYDYDAEGREQLRQPARGWADRYTGIDCDCYSIFLSSLFLNMGYSPYLIIVQAGSQSSYGHVFVLLPKSAHPPVGNVSVDLIKAHYIVIDDVVEDFDTLPHNIIKAKIIKVKLQELAGLGVSTGNPILHNLLSQKRKLDAIHHRTPLQEDELTKLNFVIALDSDPALQEKIIQIFPYIHRIDGEGLYEFAENVNPDILAAYLDNNITAVQMHVQLGEGLKGEGNDALGLFKKARQKLKDLAKKVAGEVKHDIKKAETAAGKVVHTLLKYTPATLLLRNGILGLLKANPGAISSRLRYGYLSESEARNTGLNITEYRKLVKAVHTLEDIFKGMGGEPTNLRHIIVSAHLLNGPGEESTTPPDAATASIPTALRQDPPADTPKAPYAPDAKATSAGPSKGAQAGKAVLETAATAFPIIRPVVNIIESVAFPDLFKNAKNIPGPLHSNYKAVDPAIIPGGGYGISTNKELLIGAAGIGLLLAIFTSKH